jgi:hypothetical protein
MAQGKGKRGTTTAFVAAAMRKHGARYRYDKVEYKNSSTPVEIQCPTHGPFTQTPSNHLAGKGCRQCATDVAKERYIHSSEQFVIAARAVHGDKYDYSKVNYRGARIKVSITCQAHGNFEQTPDSHKQGSGCPKCRNASHAERSRWTTEKFISKAIERFGPRFDYSKTIYVNAWTPLDVGCPDHGLFSRTPLALLHGSAQGCPACASEYKKQAHRKNTNERRLKKSDFLSRAAAIHGAKYDYRLVELIDSRKKVSIICPTHGLFEQSPGGHMSGKGCKKCGSQEIANRLRHSPSRFIERARQVHGQKYDYSSVEYTTARNPVTITCPKHGAFTQPPQTHLKAGCRKCADDALPGAYTQKRFLKDASLAERLGTLYYVRFTASDGEIFYKVGISATNPGKRFAGYAGSYGYNMEVLASWPLPLGKAHEIERRLLQDFVLKHKYLPLKTSKSGRRFGGRNECFAVQLPTELIEEIQRTWNTR